MALVWDAIRLPEAVFTEARAHRLVQVRLSEWPRASELSAQVRADPGLDDSTRAAALRIAQQLAEQPQPRRMVWASWNIVRDSTLLQEHFPDTGNPGYFIIKLALLLLALLVLIEGVIELVRPVRGPTSQ